MKVLIEIHILQNHAPSNLNRDDAGSPKDSFFGGVKRARISSQCIKRSIRKSVIFRDEMINHIGERTRHIPIVIKKRLISEFGLSEDVAQKAAEIVVSLGKSEKGETKKSDKALKLETQLMFFDQSEISKLIEVIADFAKNGKLDKTSSSTLNKELEPLMKDVKRTSVDIALFGRMTTGEFLEDVEASMQVAHALGTSKMENEYDFFTAVDDLNTGSSMEEQGAGHIGDVEFTSSTFYKYFSCDVLELVKNLNGDIELAKKTIGAFLKAAALSMPTGKQNTFAAHNPPDVIVVKIKDKKIPISYANAFIKPVSETKIKSLMDASAEALQEYIEKVNKAYPMNSKDFYLSLIDNFQITGTKCESIENLSQNLVKALSI